MPFLRVLLLALFTTASGLTQDLIGLYLMWQSDPATTMTVNWVDLHTDSPLDLHYRRVGEAAWMKAMGAKFSIADTTMQGRRVELKNLLPDTNYEFNIGKPIVKATEGWRFRTMPLDLNRPVRFVTGGDMMHTRQKLDKATANAAALDPDFALLVGDLAYANGVLSNRWVEWLKSWTERAVSPDGRLIPMVAGIGNHEVKGGYNGKAPEDAPFYYSLFRTPESRSYYLLDFGRYLSIVLLDSSHTNPVAGAQAEWLKEALAARRDNNLSSWAIITRRMERRRRPRRGRRSTSPFRLKSGGTGCRAGRSTGCRRCLRTIITTTSGRTGCGGISGTTRMGLCIWATGRGRWKHGRFRRRGRLGGWKRRRGGTMCGKSICGRMGRRQFARWILTASSSTKWNC